jgi:hypothetical protein
MTRLKKSAKAIWKYRWEIFAIFYTIANIASTIEQIIDKKYELAFMQGLFTFAMVITLVQRKVINDQGKLIDNKNELIAKQSNWIEKVTKIVEESTQKDKTSRESAEKCVDKS